MKMNSLLGLFVMKYLTQANWATVVAQIWPVHIRTGLTCFAVNLLRLYQVGGSDVKDD